MGDSPGVKGWLQPFQFLGSQAAGLAGMGVEGGHHQPG